MTMSKVQRYDTHGKLGKAKRTPQGGVEVSAALRKVGVLTYTNPDGTERREYVSHRELFSEKSLATLKNAPVTNLHPFGPGGNELVTSENFRDYSVGHLSGEVRKDGSALVGDLVIQDDGVIELVDRGDRNEVSVGYLCSYEPKPGVTPEGEHYDGIQTNVIYNHVALVPRGRAGRDVALRLDSDGNQLRADESAKGKPMKIEMIDGVEYEVGTPAHEKAVSDRDLVRADAEERITRLEAERDQYKAQIESFNAKFDAAVEERVQLVKLAESKGVSAEGSNSEIRAAILAEVSPSLKFDAADEVYVKAALDVALASSNLGEVAKNAVAEMVPEERSDADEGMAPDVLARENMVRRLNGRSEIDRFGNPVAK